MKKVILTFFIIILINSHSIAGDIPKMSYEDFFLDYSDLIGVTVGVQGFIIDLGQLTYIYDKPGSMNSILVNTEALPREMRKRMMKHCSQGCLATIIGKALDDSKHYIKILVASDIDDY